MDEVSLVTVSQYCRLEFLRLLRCMVEKQTEYDCVLEWVIVDGSPDNEQAAFEEELRSWPKVVYVSTRGNPNKRIGHLRNLSNAHARGQIVVCLDDDDYYPPTRVERVLEAFRSNPGCEVAGTQDTLLYDHDLQQVFRVKKVLPNYSPNNCLCYRLSFVRGHRYDDQAAFNEEESFLGGFTVPLLEISYEHAVLQLCHAGNTYNKRAILFNQLVLPPESRYVFPVAEGFESLVGDPALVAAYRRLFGPAPRSAYDLDVYAGYLSAEWDPRDPRLGGSEQGIVELGAALAERGWSVGVYGNFAFETLRWHGVDYHKWTRFRLRTRFRHLVLWRFFGAHGALQYLDRALADRVVLDMHDHGVSVRGQDLGKVDKVVFKSLFHASTLAEAGDRAVVIPNGVRRFPPPAPEAARERARFCYASCYTRGLERLLRWFWPELRRRVPEAALHVYYGTDLVQDKDFVGRISVLLKQPGVTDHGRVSAAELAAERARSTFHLYFTDTEAETDCISIKESAASGCLPLLSEKGVFPERPGLHHPGDPASQEAHVALAARVAGLIRGPSASIFESVPQPSWRDVALEWEKLVLLPRSAE